MKLSKSMRTFIADGLESYMDIREQCLISEVPPETEDKQIKKMKKLIRKIRKGDMSVFNMERLEEELPRLEHDKRAYEAERGYH